MTLKSTTYHLKILSKIDIPGLLDLSASVQWDYDNAQICTILNVGTIYGHKDEKGRLVSCAAVIPYEEKLATIGMVIVHSSCRGLGLARELIEACLETVSPETTVMLISTEQGKPLYESLGFVIADHIHKHLCDSLSHTPTEEVGSNYELLPMDSADLPAVSELDARAVGSRRTSFLRAQMHQAATCLVAKDSGGQMVGFGFAVHTPVNLVIGPLVAVNDNVAASLLYELSHNHAGKIRIDVPDGQQEFISFLERSGFTKATQPPIMVARSERLPKRNGTYYGIAAQIYG